MKHITPPRQSRDPMFFTIVGKQPVPVSGPVPGALSIELVASKYGWKKPILRKLHRIFYSR